MRAAVWLQAGSAAFLLLCAGLAHAHGVTITARLLEGGEAVAALFRYSSGEPMAYAAVTVRGPNESGIEFQNGRADALGRFVFLPDEQGVWLVQVDDGMGHRGESTVEVTGEGGAQLQNRTMAQAQKRTDAVDGSALAPVRAMPVWLAAVLGGSLIVNVFFFMERLKRRNE